MHVLSGMQVRNYFNTAGFDRWRKIYGETDEVHPGLQRRQADPPLASASIVFAWLQVNKVQMDIRKGHAQTVEKVLKWVDEEGGVDGITVADAGCGTGVCVCSTPCMQTPRL
jgi:magnesium-protoporphyrin O-methyltransferase